MLFPLLNRKLRGYYNYSGVKGYAAGIQEFYGRAMEILLEWLNRGSQRLSFKLARLQRPVGSFRGATATDQDTAEE